MTEPYTPTAADRFRERCRRAGRALVTASAALGVAWISYPPYVFPPRRDEDDHDTHREESRGK